MALTPTNTSKVCSKLGLYNDKDLDILILPFKFEGNLYEGYSRE